MTAWALLLKKALTAAIPMIPELISAGASWLKNLGQAPAMNANNREEDIEKICESIEELREHILRASEKMVRNASDAVVLLAQEQLLSIEDRKSLLERYQISTKSVEFRLSDIQDGLREFWEESLYRKISLDNRKCRAVLVLPPGEKKAAEIQKFTDAILAETMSEYVELIQSRLEGLFDELEEKVADAEEQLEDTLSEYTALMESMDTGNEEKLEQMVSNAYEKAAVCTGIMEKAGA